MATVRRLTSGSGSIWRDAIDRLVPAEDRDGELLSVSEAERALEDDRCYLLVVETEEVVGLLSAYRFPDVECGGFIVYLYDIEVARERRRQGFGKQLIEKLVELCECDNVDLIWAGTDADNRAARSTFASTGAVPESDRYTEYEWTIG